MTFSRTLVALALIGAQAAPVEPRPEFWALIERAVDEGGARAEFDAVLEHLRGVDARRGVDPNRLACVVRGLAEPWVVPALARELQEQLAAPAFVKRGPRFAGVCAQVAQWLDLGPDFVDRESETLRELDATWAQLEDPGRVGLPLLESFSYYMELAQRALDESIAPLDARANGMLFSGFPAFLEGWYRNHFPQAKLTEQEAAGIEDFKSLLLAPRTDRALRLRVTAALLRLAEPDFLHSLPRRLAKVSEEVDRAQYGPDVLAVIGDEPFNRVILGGRGKARHATPAALIIDLAGKDHYLRAALVDSGEMLASVVLDLGGDDSYESSGAGPCYAVGGVALLVDLAGDDHYTSTRAGQAASALGSAILIDYEGDDLYEAQDYSQAHATCGLSLLYDMQGDDSYSAWAFAQGGGIGYGLCALIDAQGDDHYLADRHWPDVYGDSGADVYHGASQGYCTGIRSDVAGGIAALLDLGDGADRYQSGSFAQGGGYYFSFGLMYDGGGDDENFGSRYSQGFGVHQAIGVRWDAGGDDAYTCRSVAHTGMGWDEGVGYLLEDGGDDRYQTGALSCGGAAQTAIAILIDSGGKDSYQTGPQSQGGTGGFEYHDKPALGVLLDLGGSRDSYSLEGRADSALRVTPGVELFLDSQARSLERALAGRSLK